MLFVIHALWKCNLLSMNKNNNYVVIYVNNKYIIIIIFNAVYVTYKRV